MTKILHGNTKEKEDNQNEIPKTSKMPKLNILLAEDNIVNQEVAKSTLNIIGHQCTIAETEKK